MRFSRPTGGVALAALLALPAGAQPAVEASAVAVGSPARTVALGGTRSLAVADTLLPVLDDDGQPISEATIAAVARPKGTVRSVLYPLLWGITGMTLMSATPGFERECSSYEPCSDRERFYKSTALTFGFVAGAVLGYALPAAGEVTRLEAVQRIRDARRKAREERNP